MLIEGYDHAPLVAGERLLSRPGFWSNHLMAMCGGEPGAPRPVPEWFGDDGADVDALSETLFGSGQWPVFRLPFADGPGVVAVYRNRVGDHGIDYLLVQPGRSIPRSLGSWEENLSGTGLTWHELLRIADGPSLSPEGVKDPAARLLLLLPLLSDPDVPRAAPARLRTALVSAGAPQDTAGGTAARLLAHLTGRPGHDRTWASPLSGSRRTGNELPTEL
ncbi:hypothetical protein ACFWBV_00605 [Streptomyces sp. NPDC060030]|uniref:hypothetical protein n=1 Tax=Streptomyces sp. NPDC060030 TaxID=3347042 RepID=UPI00369DE4E9